MLRLLDAETKRSRMQLNDYRENPERITEVTEYTLRFAGWDASKAQIAQLLNDATQLADIIHIIAREASRASSVKERLVRVGSTVYGCPSAFGALPVTCFSEASI